MDLIQLDMQGTCYKDFLLGNCCGGIDFTCTVVRQRSFLADSELRKGEFTEHHVY